MPRANHVLQRTLADVHTRPQVGQVGRACPEARAGSSAQEAGVPQGCVCEQGQPVEKLAFSCGRLGNVLFHLQTVSGSSR
jgi:hypothetical protein